MRPDSMQTVQLSLSDYALLFVIMFIAVTGGNLLSNYITARVVEHELRSATNSAVREADALAAALSEETRERADAARAAVRRERELSATGRTLARQCGEWRRAHRENATEATRQGVARHCARYDSYIDTGIADSN